MSAVGRLAGLHRLAELAIATGDAELVQLGDELALWLSGHNDTPLERALGIAAEQSQRSARTTAAIASRDEWLRRAAAEFGVGAPELAAAVAEYETRIWPREAHLDACPERHRETLKWHLWHALRAWPHGPKERRLRDILSIGNEQGGLIAEKLCDRESEKEADNVPTDERFKRRSTGS